MAERVAVAVDLRPGRLRFPATIDRRLGFQARVHPKIVQHAIGLQRQEIGFSHALRVEEGALVQCYVGYVEGLQAGRSFRTPLRTMRENSARHRRPQAGNQSAGGGIREKPSA